MDDVENRELPWTRPREGRVIAGVCAGFANHFRVSPWMVRAVLIFATAITAGLAAVVYVILAITLPSEAEFAGEAGDEAEADADAERDRGGEEIDA
jgi:phage shock protein C